MTLLAPSPRHEWTGEIVGTFILVFFGCGAVCAAVLTGAQTGVFQVAIVWGLAVTMAILLTGRISGAHLNPAVTFALATWAGFPWAKTPRYVAAQFIGAMLAAVLLLVLFGDALHAFEKTQGLTRGAPGSEASAMVITEFFPNPGGHPLLEATRGISLGQAMAAEIAGTAMLMLIILGVTDARNQGVVAAQVPWIIGLTVTALISVISPLTMAGFNPARDLGPRLIAALAGWGSEVFRHNGSGWFTVYVLAPILGAQLGGLVHARLLGPAYLAKP